MTATLQGGINATVKTIRVAGGAAAVPGHAYKIDDELIVLRNFQQWPRAGSPVDPTRWIVKRGRGNSTAASHSNGATIVGVADTLAGGSSLTPPSPFSGGGGSISATDGTTDIPAVASWTLPPGTLGNSAGADAVVDFQLHTVSDSDIVFSVWDENDSVVAEIFGSGAVILDLNAGAVTPLSVNAPANAGNGLAIFRINSIETVVLGGNDNMGYASLGVTNADHLVPALNVAKLPLSTLTGVLSVWTAASDALGKIGFYGATAVTRPEVPATPTAQDVVDALVALGLITQAP